VGEAAGFHGPYGAVGAGKELMTPLDLQSPFVLSPMCDFTSMGKFVAQVGPPDLFHIEYARVHANTSWSQDWLDFVCGYGPQHRVIAQLIGCEPEYFVKALEFARKLPISGIDLNLGCPAPKIYKQNVGGGLLRDLDVVDRIVGTLREAIDPPLTLSVKFRLGFENPDAWEGVFSILKKHSVDWCTVHLRTVSDGYRVPARFNLAHEVVEASPCPILLNGDIQTVTQGRELIASTGAWGVSIGRAALRYPWIFRRAHGGAPATYAEAYEYLKWIVTNLRSVGHIKGHLNFLGLSVDAQGRFLKRMRQSRTTEELLRLGEETLLPRGSEIFPEAPFSNLYARPSMEKPKCGSNG
jgi:tRNA-dihydrouridine synthase